MSEAHIHLNGVNGATGGYAGSPMTTAQVADLAQGKVSDPPPVAFFKALKRWVDLLRHKHLGVKEGVDVRDLSQAGWAVIFPEGGDPAIREALGPLLSHRRRQAAARKECRYGELTYRRGEEKWDFLDRHDVGFGPADPDLVSYYLLLVGGPDEIPFRFQYELDVEYAVGRLHFEHVADYGAYAEAVVKAEQESVDHNSRAVFFGVRNPDDITTEQSADFLVEPLADAMAASRPDWQIERMIGEQATKARLAQVLGGGEPPSVLFSASHGLCFPAGHRRQLPHQGAVLCQDWPGPRAWTGKGIPTDHYFAGEDLAGDVRLNGLIAMHFGCYGAGTPRLQAYAHRHGGSPEILADRAFIAELPQRLLTQGALAVIAHVEQCWGYSYLGLAGGERLQTFDSMLRRLWDGYPVGSAMEYFNRRYAEIATALSAALKKAKFHQGGEKSGIEEKLSRLWTAEIDARSYIILGDPAVRLGKVLAAGS